jgi:hypothetical protein
MPDLYIGKTWDAAARATGQPFTLDSGDLTTHGIVIGMTGSGKTGFSICIIEELLRSRIPVIVIDPKGDMTNLALAFDRLEPDRFKPWIDRDEAAREQKTVADVATETAEAWKQGLGQWALGEADVAAFAAGRRMRIFTPGTAAGIPLNLIDSMAWPGVEFEEEEEELRDEIDSIVTGLLGFVKIDADPLSSREYILLFSLIEAAWRKREGLTLESLIGQVAAPPLERVGALPVESFFPRKERNSLVFALNNLVASPRFEAWREGEPADIERWVRSEDGRPQLSVVYTAHLDDDERTFVTALLLNKLKTWMRKQPGTGELRCLFYMDEIFGYFPPTANPPTKKPLLTLLKQARAYGVGVLLSTQNPVDLDYKGLANMGFWAIGRLQTTQDQQRVRQGIEAALADAGTGLDFENLIAGVQKRVFLVHDIHRKAPELVHSRWAMSYLRGPLTRDEIRELPPEMTAWQDGGGVKGVAKEPAATAAAGPATAAAAGNVVPPLAPPLRAYFSRRRGGTQAEPYLFVKAAVRYRAGGETWPEETREVAFPLAAAETAAAVLEREPIPLSEGELHEEQPGGVALRELPAFLQSDAKPLERALRDRLDDRLVTETLYDAKTREWALPGEDAFAFAERLRARGGSSAKRRALEERIAKKRAEISIKEQEVSGRRMEKWASVGTAILGGLFGTRRSRSTRGIGTVLSKNRMESTAAQRKAKLETELSQLEAQLQEHEEIDPGRFERRILKPAKADVSLIRYDIAWLY